MKLYTLASIIFLTLSACGTADIATVRNGVSSGDNFDRALFERYRKLALFEHDEMSDWNDERTKSPPFGLNGGQAGTTARIVVTDASGGERTAPGKGAFDVPSGGLINLSAPGSGGYGNPGERDPAMIREDLLDGYVTEEGVRRDYGVDPDILLLGKISD